MDIFTPSMATAALKSASSVTTAAIGRYRPTGIPRLGSKEDRNEAYRRLLDASTRACTVSYMVSHMQREVGRAAHKFLIAQLPTLWEAGAELLSALHGVRLCGTVQVIAAAETLVSATSDLEINERNADVFQAQTAAMVAAQRAFLDACREDLAYATRWYQVLRRRQERRFLRQQANAAQAATPPAAGLRALDGNGA